MARTRREFLALGAACAAPFSIAAAVQKCERSLIVVELYGGVAQTDFWDAKRYTPFRRGMRARDILGTCPTIATRADGVRFGAGLECLAAQMNRGTVVRSVVNDAPKADRHYHARRQWALKIPESQNFYAQADAQSFAGALKQAFCAVGEGRRSVRVAVLSEPFEGFDTHENGAARNAALKLVIDRPLAEMIEALASCGRLDRTVVAVVSEFGRTVVDSDRPLENESEFGFHAHFSACSSALLFGGEFAHGAAIGRTADEHPMKAIDGAMTLLELKAKIGGVV